jgi:putative oxidoreductase
MKFFHNVNAKLVRFGLILAPFALLIMRLAWGWELAESGYGHLTHLADTANFFQTLHIPMPRANAIVSGVTELVGGSLWMAGFATRLISIPVFFNMAVAIVTDAHDKLVHVFSNPDGLIDYAAFPFLIVALILMAFGAGIFSVDGFLKATMGKQSATPKAGYN